MKHMLKKYSWVFIVILAIVSLGIGYWVFNKMTSNDSVSEKEAFNLIQQCKVDGIYGYHTGEAGLILKPTQMQTVQGASVDSSPTDNFLRVRGTTAERLLQHENSSCPFTRRVTE